MSQVDKIKQNTFQDEQNKQDQTKKSCDISLNKLAKNVMLLINVLVDERWIS
jgi:hypothetical protein